MKFVSRALFVIAVTCSMLAQPMLAQQYGKISETEQPPASMRYVPLKDYIKAQDAVSSNYVTPPLAAPAPGDDGELITIGTMINGYTSQSTLTNQVGYNWAKDIITLIYRAGPEEQYPDPGNGMLVLNTSTDGGASWSGNSEVFNSDLKSNMDELSARHPSIYSLNSESGTDIAAHWGQIFATFLNPSGVLGELAYKAGPLGGAYQGGKYSQDPVLQYFPTRMVADKAGNLYSLYQTINPDQDTYTGEYFVSKSTDRGITWQVDYNNPCVTEAELEDNYQIFYTSMALDVSPDGSVVYVAFMGIFVEDGSFTFTDNRLGYVRSTDGGATWSDPVMYPLYEWTFTNTPSGAGVNTLDGWMIPSIGLAIDGENQPHFLMSVNGRDTFYPLDSTLVGEVTINVNDNTEPPEFYTLALNILPDFRRKINPRGATSGAQPDFSIWAEHDWAKTPDGDVLYAKWIDADSLFVVAPAGHDVAFERDSTHDIFWMKKVIADKSLPGRGWGTTTDLENAKGWPTIVDGDQTRVFDIHNATNSAGVDEKFTKMNSIVNPTIKKLYFVYTIMATGEFVPGQIYPDTDDTGPATLYFVPSFDVVSNSPTEGLPEGFTLEQNYPNPFNPSTTLTFSMHQAGNAKITVYNMLGKEVATAYDSFTEAGPHVITFNAKNLSSGQYMYRLEANGYTTTRIMTLMK